MARQKGIIKINGRLDDLVFFQSRHGHLVRMNKPVSADRIANDPAFQRTRENGVEFKNSATSAKMLRDAIRSLLLGAKDPSVNERLSQVMAAIKKCDSISVRGARNVAAGIATPSGLAALRGFNFNIHSPVSAKVKKPFTVDNKTGVISYSGLVPKTDVIAPPAATHVQFKGAWLRLDFSTGVYELIESNVVNLPIDAHSVNVDLLPPAVPSGTGTDLFILKLEFFQETNGAQYALSDVAFTSLAIVDAA
jgi:hypothetical protein